MTGGMTPRRSRITLFLAPERPPEGTVPCSATSVKVRTGRRFEKIRSGCSTPGCSVSSGRLRQGRLLFCGGSRGGIGWRFGRSAGGPDLVQGQGFVVEDKEGQRAAVGCQRSARPGSG